MYSIKFAKAAPINFTITMTDTFGDGWNQGDKQAAIGQNEN